MRTTYTSEQIAKLQKNPCVWHVSQKTISYTYEFKKHTLDMYAQGIRPDEIWRQAGFDVSIWKPGYCRHTLKDWRRLVKKGGLESLTKPSGIQSDGGYKKAALEARTLRGISPIRVSCDGQAVFIQREYGNSCASV